MDAPKKTNKGLIITIVIITVLAIAGIIGTWYYMYNQQQKKSQQQQQEIDDLNSKLKQMEEQKTQSTSSQTTKLTSYTTKYEKLKFQYPSDYKLVDSSVAGTNVDPPQDRITITAPSGMEMSIHTGAFGIGGSCEDCIFPLADPLTVLAKQRFLNFVQSQGTVTAGISDKPNQYINAIDGKNILVDGKTTFMLFGINYGKGKTLKDYQADPALEQYKKLLQGMTY